MTNWRDPALVAKDYLASIRLIHVVTGIIIWEVVVTCKYELAVLTGRRTYRWTIWIYVWCRISTLISFICIIIPKDFTGLTNCRAWDVAVYTWGYIAMSLASSIIILRIIAIWDRNVYVSVLSMAVWIGSFTLNVRHITLVRSIYDPLAGVCMPINTVNNLANGIGIAVSDIVLLIVMLVGIMRHRPQEKLKLLGPRNLFTLLWHQRLMWLALAALAEIPAVVLLALNLNDALNVMCQSTMSAILTVGATRMYRSLSSYRPFTEFHLTDPSDGPPTELRFRTMLRDDETHVTDPEVQRGVSMGRIHLDFDGARGDRNERKESDDVRVEGSLQEEKFAMAGLGEV
ncbi:hypothetical protein FA95DRAFT_1561225 [Auriscalpium vulgare]|uniref:Uncharacterized protein n=1 Tax=Auriscalpium vulgare TaxID=40419 RepID=A0ACB8RMC3_9AGAM|nr:hypothetical protein FA95DRAFT_1561225 [Auriscalpium vulgare]